MEKALTITDSLDRVIHERARLGIMTVLVNEGETEFMVLKKILALSDGNLNAHLKVLEKHGYVLVKKEFIGKKPRTLYRVTPVGEKAFQEYINGLDRFLKSIS